MMKKARLIVLICSFAALSVWGSSEEGLGFPTPEQTAKIRQQLMQPITNASKHAKKLEYLRNAFTNPSTLPHTKQVLYTGVYSKLSEGEKYEFLKNMNQDSKITLETRAFVIRKFEELKKENDLQESLEKMVQQRNLLKHYDQYGNVIGDYRYLMKMFDGRGIEYQSVVIEILGLIIHHQKSSEKEKTQARERLSKLNVVGAAPLLASSPADVSKSGAGDLLTRQKEDENSSDTQTGSLSEHESDPDDLEWYVINKEQEEIP